MDPRGGDQVCREYVLLLLLVVDPPSTLQIISCREYFQFFVDLQCCRDNPTLPKNP